MRDAAGGCGRIPGPETYRRAYVPAEHGSGPDRHTGPVHDPWEHAGRLWTSGEHFLALDAALRSAWNGYSNDEYEQLIFTLSGQDATIPVGAGRAALIGDGAVRDDSWIEVFQTRAGAVAFVQADGTDYPDVLANALDFPDGDNQDGGALTVTSGQLAAFSASSDGSEPYSSSCAAPRPGPVPPVHGPFSRQDNPGLMIPVPYTRYNLKVRWYTELDSQRTCFARWLLVPVQPSN